MRRDLVLRSRHYALQQRCALRLSLRQGHPTPAVSPRHCHCLHFHAHLTPALRCLARLASPRTRSVPRRRAGLTKQFDLSYEEVVPVNAMYNLDECAHRLCAEPRLLLGCVNNLPHSEHELMLSVTHSELIVKNDVDDSLAESEVRTEMSIAPSDLNEWSIGALATNPLRISFATKEFKAMLHFADTMPISVHFDFGGRPLILVAHTSDGLERARLECVIATNVDQAAAADDLFGDGNDEFAHNALDPQQLGVNASQLVSGAQGGLEPNVERADGTFPQTGGFGAASAQPFELGGAGAGGGREPSLAHGNGVTAAGGGYSQPPAGGMPSGDTVDTNTSLPLHAPHRPAQGQGQQPQGTGTDHISSFPSARQPTHQQHHPPSQQPSAGAAALTASHAHGAHEALRAAMEVDGSPPEAHAHAHMHGGSAGGGATTPNEGAPTPLRNNTAPDGSDTDNDDDAVGATPPDSPPSKRVCAGFVEQFALPTGPSCNR